jgi:SAM-dependent methyltransferase
MDDPVDSLVELEANLRDIARANHLFGGISSIARILQETDARSILDVGCGGADVPKALQTLAAYRRASLAITCLDRSEQMLGIAARDANGLSFVRGDATDLPFADSSFDVAMSTLSLHHFAEDDLRRSPAAYLAACAFARFFSKSALTRNDAPVSVLRAYTPPEALALAQRAGWRNPRVRSEPWFRMTLVDDAV